jgi:DNA-directed RNA polymerase subunit K/omega
MEYVPLEKLLDKSDGSVYKLVVLVSRRGLEITSGQPKLVNVAASLKPSTVALLEVAQGAVFCKRIKT